MKHFAKHRVFYLVTVVLITLFFVNRHMYLNRFNGYLYTKALDYNEFYLTNEHTRITGFQLVGSDSLKLKVEPAQREGWKVANDSSSYTVLKGQPALQLQEGINHFVLSRVSENEKYGMSIEYSKAEKSFTIIKSDLPLHDGQFHALNFWCALPKASIGVEEKEALEMLLSEIPSLNDLSETEKLKTVSLFLFKKLKSHEGSPTGDIKSLSPLAQFKLITEGKNECDCANYADIFHLFANAANLSTRRIGVAGWVDGVGISGHVFNETFIRKYNTWAMVDLTSNKTLVINSANKPLTTIEVFHANVSGNVDALRTVTCDSSFNRLDTVRYNLLNESETIHFKPSAEFYYIHPDIKDNRSFSENWEEYLGTKSHYGIYYSGNKKIDNTKHYIKLGVYNTSVAVFYFWLFLLVTKMGTQLYNKILSRNVN